MKWLPFFSRRESPDSPRPSLRDVKFDTNGLRVERRAADLLEWRDIQNDQVSARLDRAGSDRLGMPWTVDALRARCRQTAMSRGGGIVSVTSGRANGVPIVKAISKFSDGSGYLYEGTVMVRFREALCSLTLQAREHDMTGTREAITSGPLVMAGDLTLPTVVPPAVSANVEGWARDPYDETYDDSALCSLSDDERFDDVVPEHPLSKVRRWFAGVERTLTIADDLRQDVVEASPATSSATEARHRASAFAAGFLYFQVGSMDTAERLFTEAVPLRNNEPALDGPRVGQALNLLGIAREGLGRFEDAAWAFEWAVRAYSATLGDRDPETIRARANLGRAYAALGRDEQAESLLNEVIAALEAEQQRELELAVAVNAMGLVRQAQHRHVDARPYFERALALFEKLMGPNYFECATVLRNLARSAEELGDSVGSRRALKRAERILQQRSS